jgi:RNA-splicing ligase RtcB
MTVQQVIHEPGHAPVKVWTNDIEAQAYEQLRLLSSLPFIHKHVAVMPDVHAGIGSMGAKSFIVRGKGNADSFCSCSHGAGRRMSRTEAHKRFTVADLAEQTAGVECRKDSAVIDEIPSAYKPIDEVIDYQSDLIEVVATLRQIVCVKG